MQEENKTSNSSENKEDSKKKKRIRFIVVAVILGVGLIFGIRYIIFTINHESTDDAQLDADQYQIIPQVSGRVTKSYMNDYETVKEGDTLFTIEKDAYKIKVAAARAALENARAKLEIAKQNLSTQKSALGITGSNILAVEAEKTKADKDFERAKNLIKADVITQSDYDAAETKATAANAKYEVVKAQNTVSFKKINSAINAVKAAEAYVSAQQANLDQAKLYFSYTNVLAPANGRLAEVSIKAGTFVQAGQPLTALVGDSLWVTANFKETQIKDIKTGRSAVIKVDAYPDKDFKGKVHIFSPATGARFSLLPPDNATGNFVKVVQRVPIKISFVDSIPTNYHLEAGMNVTVTIPTD